MRVRILSLCCAALLVALGSALPMAKPEGSPVTVVELLPAQAQESLGEAKTDSSTVRDKRTVGFLREYFPSITEIIDQKIQTITRFVFRLIGRLVLGGGGAGATATTSESDGSSSVGASSSGTSGGTGRRISITLPTYPPSLDDDEDEEEEEEDSAASSSNDVLAAAASDAVAASTQRPESLRRSDSSRRVARATADQESAASDTGADITAEDSENRDKRFLFGFGGGEGGGSGSAGGSGNFLFDIIRLIAGSGNTEEAGDGHETTGGSSLGYSAVGAQVASEVPELGHSDKDDGYTSGIPGPITRLFIIANRGVSNLIQDLILRLAQTSERIVNFKARLITSVI